MSEVSAKKPSGKKSKAQKKKVFKSREKCVNAEGGLETVDFILKHLRMNSWTAYEGVTYTLAEVICLLDTVISVLQQEKSLVRLSPPITIVGALNGSYHDLVRILNIKEGTSPEDDGKLPLVAQKFVFLGDYTEKGNFNLETICLLFSLKVLFPTRYTLLRGHQESHRPKERSKFRDEVRTRFKENYEVIWKRFNEAFDLLPLSALIGEKILCVHAGISSEARKLDDLKKIPEPVKSEDPTPIVRDLLYSCPMADDALGADSNEPMYVVNVKQNYSKQFNEAAVRTFCNENQIDLIVRSHEVPPNGFRFFADEKMITVFSVANYNNYGNKAAVLKVNKEGVVSIVQMKKKKEGNETEEMKRSKKSDVIIIKSKGTPKKTMKKKEEEEEKEEEEKNKLKKKEEEQKEEKKKKKPPPSPQVRPSREIESAFDNEN